MGIATNKRSKQVTFGICQLNTMLVEMSTHHAHNNEGV